MNAYTDIQEINNRITNKIYNDLVEQGENIKAIDLVEINGTWVKFCVVYKDGYQVSGDAIYLMNYDGKGNDWWFSGIPARLEK